MTRAWGITFLATLGLIGFRVALVDTQETPRGEWPYFGGDRAFTRYSPLDQITRANVQDLQVVWRRPATAIRWTEEVFPELDPDHYLRSTPLMVDGVLYASNALGFVEAFHPGTGRSDVTGSVGFEHQGSGHLDRRYRPTAVSRPGPLPLCHQHGDRRQV